MQGSHQADKIIAKQDDRSTAARSSLRYASALAASLAPPSGSITARVAREARDRRPVEGAGLAR
jgi:hypothetical protein